MKLSKTQLNDIYKSILLTEEREGNFISNPKHSFMSEKFSNISSKKQNSRNTNVLNASLSPLSRSQHKQREHAFSNEMQHNVLSPQNLATSNSFECAKKINEPLSNVSQTKQQFSIEKRKDIKRKKNTKFIIDKKAKKSVEVHKQKNISNKFKKPKLEKSQQISSSDSDFDEITIKNGDSTDKIIQSLKYFSSDDSMLSLDSNSIENTKFAVAQKSTGADDDFDEASIDSSTSINQDVEYLSSPNTASSLNDDVSPMLENNSDFGHLFLSSPKCIKAHDSIDTFRLFQLQYDADDQPQYHIKSLDSNLNHKVTKIKVFESSFLDEDYAPSSSSTQDSFENIQFTEGTTENGSENLPLQEICTMETNNEASIIDPNLESTAPEPLDHESLNDNASSTDKFTPENIERSLQEISANKQSGIASSIVDLDTGSLQALAIFENSNKTNDVLAVLKSGIEFYGTVTVTLLCGQIVINGYKPSILQPLTIYSPRGFSSVQIWPINNKIAKGILDLEELEKTFSKAQLDNIVRNYGKRGEAVVMLQRNSGSQRIINTFSKYMAENVFPQVKTLSTARPLYTSECLLQCLINRADANRGVIVPRPWNKIVLQSESRVMITGGKSVGKSTMLRYLLNSNLSRFTEILLIDLDIGQPELFVPQTVSCSVIKKPLLGPGFFLNKQPDKAFVVGHVNIVMCPEQYARAVRQLLEHCHKNSTYSKMPWLVNTMGYNKGFGLELVSLLIGYIKPTDVIQFSSQKDINNFDALLTRETLSNLKRIIYTGDEFRTRTLPQYTLHHIDSTVTHNGSNQNIWTMSAKEIRYATLLTRLSATLKGNAEWLTSCQPVGVSLDALKILHLTSAEYTRDELIAGMEANIVYLCQQDMPADKAQPECIGIGVVRAIDYNNKKLYLVPAMPFEHLTRVNCLVLGGDLTLPQGYYKDQGPGVANNVPFVFIIDDTNFSKSIKHIYFRAPEFLGGTKQ